MERLPLYKNIIIAPAPLDGMDMTYRHQRIAELVSASWRRSHPNSRARGNRVSDVDPIAVTVTKIPARSCGFTGVKKNRKKVRKDHGTGLKRSLTCPDQT